MPQLHFYYREGCHLCEEMAATLFRGWPDRVEGMQWHDIACKPEWEAAYGLRIPVLSLDDEVLCEFFADIPVLEQRFGKPLNPV